MNLKDLLNKKVLCLQTAGTSEDKAELYGYQSWIDYCHKTNLFTQWVKVCPICKTSFTAKNPAVGGHISISKESDSKGRLVFEGGYITPICKKCNSNHHSWKSFKVFKLMLCCLPKTPPKR